MFALFELLNLNMVWTCTLQTRFKSLAYLICFFCIRKYQLKFNSDRLWFRVRYLKIHVLYEQTCSIDFQNIIFGRGELLWLYGQQIPVVFLKCHILKNFIATNFRWIFSYRSEKVSSATTFFNITHLKVISS